MVWRTFQRVGRFVHHRKIGIITASATVVVGVVLYEKLKEQKVALAEEGSEQSAISSSKWHGAGDWNGYTLSSPKSGIKWDENWDKRDPKKLVKPPKNTEESKKEYDEEVKKKTPKATRHLILIRHGQYVDTATTDIERILTSLGGLGHHVVMTVGKNYLGKGHHFYHDNFFTSIALADELLAEKTRSCGTIRMNRKGWPADLKVKAGKGKKKMSRGEALFRQLGQLVATLWQDKRPIAFLSTNANPVMGIARRHIGKGRQQAELTGERLRDLDLDYTRMISSTMSRAVETADIIHKYMPGLSLDRDDLLREGAPIQPEPKHYSWRPEQYQFFQDSARIESAFRKYFHRADPEQKGDSVEIVVCHANVIRYFVCRALQFPSEGWLRISLAHTSLTHIMIRPSGRVTLRCLGNSGHLPPTKVTYS